MKRLSALVVCCVRIVVRPELRALGMMEDPSGCAGRRCAVALISVKTLPLKFVGQLHSAENRSKQIETRSRIPDISARSSFLTTRHHGLDFIGEVFLDARLRESRGWFGENRADVGDDWRYVGFRLIEPTATPNDLLCPVRWAELSFLYLAL